MSNIFGQKGKKYSEEINSIQQTVFYIQTSVKKNSAQPYARVCEK